MPVAPRAAGGYALSSMASSTPQPRLSPLSPEDAVVLALRALAWIVSDPEHAQRFLALTGLEADTLRSSAGDPALLAETIGYLLAHEPTLVACAAALDAPPSRFADARALIA
jgi:hypothetical protein